MNPLHSIKGVWIAGILLSVLLAVVVNLMTGFGVFNLQELPLLRWMHIVAGIIWVGLLYYFNFVQMPAMAAATADAEGPGPAAIARYIAPRALLWFRWAAVVTWLSGALYLFRTDQFINAFSLGLIGSGPSYYGLTMGLGAWLGTILLINVWFVIWPNQKKILGLAKSAAPVDVAKAKRHVMIASRVNAILSLPMLMFMVAAKHGVAF
ncbi:urate hydroxylase PuuD [Thioalkalicoccus limnaeus]|uniref:Urate hydroxylase PuuD n=1 Tax=Thioalkalicoccus limnaeus TaxID=120681 RepID=A0ABV4BGS7_9GAMM